MPIEDAPEGSGAPAIPLARWADRQLKLLAEETGSQRIAALDGATIVGERGSNGDYAVGGRVSAGIGGSRLYETRDGGWFALTILRDIDREMLPALFLGDIADVTSNAAIAEAVARHDVADLVSRGRDLGLPVASADEVPAAGAVEVLCRGPGGARRQLGGSLVVDLSAIWAGPLIGHLLWLAGAEVVKVESLTRPDLIRRDDPATFDLLNQGKASVLLDFASEFAKARLIELIRGADFVIESSRPRALKHLGIDANRMVAEVPGLVWVSVTGHGASGAAANWAGIGNDCGVAAGLTRQMADLTGEIGYVGDALPDPLTGITGAREAVRAHRSSEAQRIGLSMTAITARALAEERSFNSNALNEELCAWSAAVGRKFPQVPRRPMLAPVAALGADTRRYFPELARC